MPATSHRVGSRLPKQEFHVHLEVPAATLQDVAGPRQPHKQSSRHDTRYKGWLSERSSDNVGGVVKPDPQVGSGSRNTATRLKWWKMRCGMSQESSRPMIMRTGEYSERIYHMRCEFWNGIRSRRSGKEGDRAPEERGQS